MVSPACVAREGRQHVGVPGPLLQHLAGRLDEVPLGRDAGEAGPPALAGEDVVDEVAELVEERHDLVVLHQAPVEVAHQHALGELLAGDALDHVELGRVLELALARVQVEVDPPDAGAVEVDVVAGDLVVPGAGVLARDGRPPEAEEPAGDVEEALADLLEREVGAHDLAVDVVLLPPDELGVVARVVGGHGVRGRVVDALALEEDADLVAGPLLGRLADPVDEVGDGLAVADHLDLGVVVGPRVVAEQLRGLAAHRQQVLEHLVVGGPGDVVLRQRQLVAGLGVGAEGDERDQVGVVGGDGDEAVLVGGVGGAVVLGQAGQPLGRDPDRADVVADVATEVLRQLDALLAERAEPVAGGVVTVDAGAAEVAQRVLEHAGGRRRRGPSRTTSRAGRRRRTGRGPGPAR